MCLLVDVARRGCMLAAYSAGAGMGMHEAKDASEAVGDEGAEASPSVGDTTPRVVGCALPEPLL